MHKNLHKTKILYIITKSNWGGAQRYVFDMATNVVKDGYETIVVLGGEGSLYKKLKQEKIKTVKILQLKRDVKITSEWKVFFSLLKILKDERPDVVHLNSSKIGGLGAFAARIYNLMNTGRKKSIIIFTAHGWAYKEDRNIVIKKIIKFISWITIVLSHKTITVSHDDFEKSPKLFVRRKIKMIHNGISETKFKARVTARAEIKKLLGCPIPKDAVWIGTISELHKNKGLTYMIRAVERLIEKKYNIVFIIIGSGEEKMHIKKFIKDLKLDDKIFLLGQVDNASKLLQAFDIFTLTSTKEGLPYSLLEAGSAGVTSIASNVGGISEIIENNKTGKLVRSKNSQDIERVLSYLIDDKKERSKLGNNLKTKVHRDFTVEQMVADTLELYR